MRNETTTNETPGPSAALSPQARALLEALANLGTASADPWAKYPPILGVEHVAEILDMQPSAVSEAARRKRLPMRKILGKWRIDAAVLRQLAGYDPAAPAAGRAG